MKHREPTMAEAREIIARSLVGGNPDECVQGHGWSGPDGGGFRCTMRAWEVKLRDAQYVIQDLTAAGFRIIPPGELDAETLERAAAKLESIDLPPKHDGEIVEAVEALRSLSPKGGTP